MESKNTRNFGWTYLVAAAFFAISGCKQAPEKAVLGSWTQQKSSDNLAGALVNSLLPKVRLDLASDHHFELSLPSLTLELHAGAATATTEQMITGQWQMSGHVITFTTERIGGKSVAELSKQLEEEAAKQHDRQMRQQTYEQLRQRQLAMNGYLEQPNEMPTMPVTVAQVDEKPQTPQTATLSDDGVRLTLEFANGAAPVKLAKRD